MADTKLRRYLTVLDNHFFEKKRGAGNYMTNEYELYHFGVKGMKWGVRKDKAASGGQGGIRNRLKNSKAQRDFKKFKKNANTLANDYNNFYKTVKKLGNLVDDNGKDIPGSDIFQGNDKLYDKAVKTEAKVDKLMQKLEKRYKNVAIRTDLTDEGRKYMDVMMGELSERLYFD